MLRVRVQARRVRAVYARCTPRRTRVQRLYTATERIERDELATPIYSSHDDASVMNASASGRILQSDRRGTCDRPGPTIVFCFIDVRECRNRQSARRSPSSVIDGVHISRKDYPRSRCRDDSRCTSRS